MRLLIFGDSITEGYYDYNNGGWVNLLKTDFWKNRPNIEVANLGISGDEVIDITKRIEIEINAFTGKFKDDFKIIFAVGINDSVYYTDKNKEKYSKEDFRNNLEKLVNIATKYNKYISFLGLTKVNEKIVTPFPLSSTGKCYSNNRILEFDNIIKDICKKYNFGYLYLFDLLDYEDLEDGLHPNSNGHKKIYKQVKNFLQNN